MPSFNAQRQLDKRNRETKAKTAKADKAVTAAVSNIVKGEVPEDVLDELVHAKTSAKDMAGAFADAVKAQASKYGIKPAALRKYVTAREADKLDEVRVENTQLADLLG